MENRKIKFDTQNIYQFTWDTVDSNAYIFACGSELLIFDPVDTEEFFQYISECRAKKALVILTHEHFDHISGLNRLRETLPCIVCANRECSENIQSSKKNLSAFTDVLLFFGKEKNKTATIQNKISEFSCAAADFVFEQNMEFEWHKHKLYLFTTLGHTKGSICTLVDRKYLFSGDTLLEIPTVTRLPGGDEKAFWEETMPRLKKLAEEGIEVYPGHGKVFEWKAK